MTLYVLAFTKKRPEPFSDSGRSSYFTCTNLSRHQQDKQLCGQNTQEHGQRIYRRITYSRCIVSSNLVGVCAKAGGSVLLPAISPINVK